jgi:hypothetical protein
MAIVITDCQAASGRCDGSAKKAGDRTAERLCNKAD